MGLCDADVVEVRKRSSIIRFSPPDDSASLEMLNIIGVQNIY